MRISDWSSDVCSSDEQAQSALPWWRRRPRPSPSAERPMAHMAAFRTGAAMFRAWRPIGSEQSRAARLIKLPLRSEADHVVDHPDRKSVVSGKRVSVRVDLGGRRIIKKKKTKYEMTQSTNKHLTK